MQRVFLLCCIMSAGSGKNGKTLSGHKTDIIVYPIEDPQKTTKAGGMTINLSLIGLIDNEQIADLLQQSAFV